MSSVIDRREAVRRVSVMLGGITFIGGDTLLAACTGERLDASPRERIGDFSVDDITFLDTVADTILPETSTPGAKAARTGAFIALMVTDSYSLEDQRTFRDGMQKLEEASVADHGVSFMAATAAQRLALVERLDREQHNYMWRREDARRRRREQGRERKPGDGSADEPTPEVYLPDQRQEAGPSPDASAAPAITADAPPHYFRMMKELTLLGYFTSEIGCTQAQRYIESPGRFEPCIPYGEGERTWAPHA